MSDSTHRPPAAAAQPSRNLLGQFAAHADNLRGQAGDHRLTAEAAKQAAQQAQAKVDATAERVRELLAEVERVRGEMDELQRAADEHGDRAARHQRAAEEMLADVEYLDGVTARAEQMPQFQPPPEACVCEPSGSPGNARPRDDCPVHVPGGPPPRDPMVTALVNGGRTP